jgi:hypothetical protein
MSGCALSDALLAMLPGAVVIRRREQGWHSATFSGRRLVLDLRTAASTEVVAAFTRQLGDCEFAIPDMLVADIAVTARDGEMLIVEALLLDDEV